MKSDIENKDLTRRFETLLANHADLLSKEECRLQKVLDQLVPTFLLEREKWAEAQRTTADDFNLLEVLGISRDEICHSHILAWLLDHRIEYGTHAQGNLGFQLFLTEFAPQLQALGATEVIAYADERDYWVYTEMAGFESRVDVEVAAQGKFLIHIETKILSTEGEDQTDREWRDLLVRAKALNVPARSCHAVFLTLDGCKAQNANFSCVAWWRIASVLDHFAETAKPVDVKLFARHLAKAIRKQCAEEHQESEHEDAEV